MCALAETSSRSPRPPRRLGRKLLLLAATTTLLLALIEGGVRLFGPHIEYVPMSQGLKADPVLGYRNAPGYDNRREGGREQGHVVINRQGFRDDVFDARREGDLRVLVLGDSYTYGHAVEKEELYTERLEQRLARRFPDRRVSVLNTGCPSWATVQQLGLLRELGPAFQPDLVLLQFCFNDLDGNLNEVAFLARKVEQDSFGGGLVATLARGSQAARVGFNLYFLLKNMRRARRAAAENTPGDAVAPVGSGMKHLQQVCLDLIDQIQAETEKLGAGFALFVVRQGRGSYHEMPPAGRAEDYFLVAHAASKGVPVVTFSQAVEQSGHAFEECSYSHFTRMGHEAAAAALESLLCDSFLGPGR